MPKITVLGGSSPFTVALIDAIAADEARRSGFSGCEIVLYGRNAPVLEAVATYGRHRLGEVGVSTCGATDYARALDGAEIVIAQIRFGGLEARVEDERFAANLDCPADETLGPCGLFSAFRQRRPIEELGGRLKALCPEAFVLNMINPLSLTTRLMVDGGLNAVGICELPVATFEALARELDRDPADLQWSYEGFNHRGFIVAVRQGDVDILDLVRAQPAAAAGGVLRDDILRLGAVPLKYFSLFSGRAVGGAGRAASLIALRDQLASELVRDPAKQPAPIADRDMPWYRQVVVPILAARLGFRVFDATLNIASDDGLVRERRASVLRGDIELFDPEPADGPFRDWLAMFERHERLSVAALLNPTFDNVAAALRADGITPPDKVEAGAARILGARA
jgi:6-phospho-beta-glucosidase